MALGSLPPHAHKEHLWVAFPPCVAIPGDSVQTLLRVNIISTMLLNVVSLRQVFILPRRCALRRGIGSCCRGSRTRCIVRLMERQFKGIRLDDRRGCRLRAEDIVRKKRAHDDNCKIDTLESLKLCTEGCWQEVARQALRMTDESSAWTLEVLCS